MAELKGVLSVALSVAVIVTVRGRSHLYSCGYRCSHCHSNSNPPTLNLTLTPTLAQKAFSYSTQCVQHPLHTCLNNTSGACLNPDPVCDSICSQRFTTMPLSLPCPHMPPSSLATPSGSPHPGSAPQFRDHRLGSGSRSGSAPHDVAGSY